MSAKILIGKGHFAGRIQLIIQIRELVHTGERD